MKIKGFSFCQVIWGVLVYTLFACYASSPALKASPATKSCKQTQAAVAKQLITPQQLMGFLKDKFYDRKNSLQVHQAAEDLIVLYQAAPSEIVRDALIVYYKPLVDRAAQALANKLPASLTEEDLDTEGVFGLMDALLSFDINRGIKFSTYAPLRISGQMKDFLRSLDDRPRLVRRRIADYRNAVEALKLSGQIPSDELIDEKLLEIISLRLYPKEKITAEKLKKIELEIERIHAAVDSEHSTHSMEREWFETDSNKKVFEKDTVPDRRQITPFEEAANRNTWETILNGFSRVEQLILILYYREEMNMRVIGGVVGLSESRVSQVHTSLITILKSRFSEEFLREALTPER